jgi:glycerol-3-phosphate dehydrogenase
MPITQAAYQVLYENANVAEVFSNLMSRRRKTESEDAGWL